MFCHADILDLPVPDADYDGNLDAVIDSFTQFYACTDEMHDSDKFAADVPSDKQVTARGIEVGHIFYFGTKYSDR